MKKYDGTYGDDKLCSCGHPYYRHFDSWDDNRPVGCKYCPCYNFVPANPDDGVPKDERYFDCTGCLELDAENKALKQTISNLRKAIEKNNEYNRRQSRYNQDYLPYEDDNYDR